ncbi:MAG TPA: hypothetical protein VK171_12860 [Fimbriimonas sp.]|nr:hypothetical protein [Fimbriimonas sp.]
MIWRKSYESLVSYDEPLPVVEATSVSGEPVVWPSVYVLLMGRGFEALVEQNVWWKLHVEDFPDFKHFYRVFVNLPSDSQSEVEAMIAPSQRSRTLLATGEVDELLDPTKASQSFAGLVSNSKFVMAVRGLPTEDCWEEFSNRLRSELDGSRSR